MTKPTDPGNAPNPPTDTTLRRFSDDVQRAREELARARREFELTRLQRPHWTAAAVALAIVGAFCLGAVLF